MQCKWFEKELNNLSTLIPIWHHLPLFEIKFNHQIELKTSKFGRDKKGKEFSTNCYLDSQVHGYTTCKLNKSYTKHYVHESSLFTGFHNVPGTHSHFLEGVNFTDGIPLLGWLDHLGVDGISTGSPLVMEG